MFYHDKRSCSVNIFIYYHWLTYLIIRVTMAWMFWAIAISDAFRKCLFFSSVFFIFTFFSFSNVKWYIKCSDGDVVTHNASSVNSKSHFEKTSQRESSNYEEHVAIMRSLVLITIWLNQQAAVQLHFYSRYLFYCCWFFVTVAWHEWHFTASLKAHMHRSTSRE